MTPLTREELQKIYDDDALLDRADTQFARKWVQNVVFWLIVTSAATVVTLVVTQLYTFFSSPKA